MDRCGPTPTPSSFAIAAVDEHAVHPRLEAVRVAELRQLAPRGDERVLEGVVGEVRVPEHPERDRVQPVGGLPDEGRKCVAIPAPRLLDEVSIHLGLRRPRPCTVYGD